MFIYMFHQKKNSVSINSEKKCINDEEDKRRNLLDKIVFVWRDGKKCGGQLLN